MKAGEILFLAVSKLDNGYESSCQITYGQDKRIPTQEEINIAIGELVEWQKYISKKGEE